MPPLVELKDVYKIYHMGDSEVHALDGITLTINKGEFVAINLYEHNRLSGRCDKRNIPS